MIRLTIAGRTPGKVQLMDCIDSLKSIGAEKIILGCTELSVIGDAIHDKCVIDPLKLVVNEIFRN